MTESAVSNYELGLRTPWPQRLEVLARTFGVDPAALRRPESRCDN